MKQYIVVLATVLLSTLTAHAQTVYGALAIDRSNGFYYGWAYDYASLTGAENRALKECQAKGGNCTVVLTWSGKACAAYRTIPGNVGTAYGWGMAATKEEADAIATREALKRSNGVQPTNYVWACNTVGEPKEIKNEGAPFLKNDKPAKEEIKTNTSIVKSVKIGFQEWTTENLDVKTFRNGDPIPEAKDWKDWISYWKAGKPAYIQFNIQPYGGKLYNIHAVHDPRGLAPKGWHVPNRDEWMKLINYAGGTDAALADLKSSDYWTFGSGKNRLGFTLLPVGYYGGSTPEIGRFCNFWTTSVDGEYYVTIYAAVDVIRPGTQTSSGCYIRCVKD